MLSGFSSGTNPEAELGLPELPMDEQRALLNWSQSLRESITTDAKQKQAAPGEIGSVSTGVSGQSAPTAVERGWCRLVLRSVRCGNFSRNRLR